MVETSKFGKVLRAGMDEFHTYLRIVKALGKFLPWAMLGDAVLWDISGKELDLAAKLDNEKKVARQFAVARSWISEVFETEDPSRIDALFAEFMRLRVIV